MPIKELLQKAAIELLLMLKNRDLAWAEAELLMAQILKRDRVWVVAHGDERLSAGKELAFRQLVERRLKHEPMGYILGHTGFYGREFLTDKRALIPRPETELLVELALPIIKKDPKKTLVWDVGTGCGSVAIAVALSTIPTIVEIVASDISKDAIGLAKKNAKKLKAKVEFMIADLLSDNLVRLLTRKPAKQLIVLANLPYLPNSDKKKLMPDVAQFEPSNALFTGENGNELIHKLMKQLAAFQKTAKTPLVLLAEFDPPQAQCLQQIAKQIFPKAEISVHQDLCGRERVLQINQIPA